MRWNKPAVLLLLSTVLAPGLPAADAENPLADFGAMVVGDWQAEGSRQVFEWGVGQRAIRTRSYFESDEGWTLVGEGMWYWDPGRKTIRGVAVAIGMPVELFEYSSEVRDGEIVHELLAHGPAGGNYVERWSFDGDAYRWSLEAEKDGKHEAIMGGEYRRVGGK